MSDFAEHKNYQYYISYYTTDDKRKEFVIKGQGDADNVYACIKLTQPAHDFFTGPQFNDCFDKYSDKCHHRLWIQPKQLLKVAELINSTDKVVRTDQSSRGFYNFIEDVNKRTRPPQLLVCSVPKPSEHLRSRL